MTVGEMPSHTHDIGEWTMVNSRGGNSGIFATQNGGQSNWSGNERNKQNNNPQNTGGGGYHNNLQPSKAIYRFRRTA